MPQEWRGNFIGLMLFFKIFLLIVFLAAIALFLFFVMNVLMPTVKKLILEDIDPIFAPFELDYTRRVVDNGIAPTENRAVVLALPGDEQADGARLFYNGIRNCVIFEHVYGTASSDNMDCIGFGDCASACPQEAIDITQGCAVVTSNCCGCGACVKVCPKHLIGLFPKERKSFEFKNGEKPTRVIEIPEKKGFKIWKDCYIMFR